MPKKSRVETKVTIEKILDAVTDQLLRLGYDKMSYTTLSRQTGISRTGISHHFPKKTDFMLALDSRLYEMFISYLDMDEHLEEFSASWLRSLATPEFSSILRVMFHHTVSNETNDYAMKEGVIKLNKLLCQRFGDKSKKELEWLIGKSLVKMTFEA